MVARKFLVEHGASSFDVDYDTDDGLEVLKFQLFSLTSIPPDHQKILGADGNTMVSDDSDLGLISDKLRLISIDEDDNSKPVETSIPDIMSSDEEFARRLQAEEEALMMQQFVTSENREQVEQRIRPYIHQVLMYEDPQRQEDARKTVPVDRLEEKAAVALAREGNFKPTKDELDHGFLLQLLFWFKQSFRWVNSPPCDSCNSETMNQGMGTPTNSESHYGASRVELYRCKSCSSVTRFPRYNDPIKLLETRKGRCGEWANCFTLYCRAFGYETRLILDFTDHVWTECFSPYLGRWMHLDPCEGIYDNPLLYEKGWGKKLNYVIALARDGVYDVTKRYTKKWHEVLSRRVMTTEPALASIISDITRERRRSFSSEKLVEHHERDKKEVEEMERSLSLQDDMPISLPGRQSGDKEWRVARSEFGSDEHCSLSSSSCPVRKCVDEHVTRIYDAFLPLLRQLVEEASNSSKATDVLDIIRKILIGLKSSPFKTRRTKIDAASNSLLSRMPPSLGQLFDALSLKCEPGVGGVSEICIASDPVKTSLALPVVFHALDDLIQNVRACKELKKESLSWPLLKLNRICSGFILASGEELPFGIATSAFDGTRLSKFEEPNGATGCWIIYKVLDNRMHELVSYELMSANDAPERDPMDWILEGSEDGGSTWLMLDKQTSEKFDKRFQRKTFEVGSRSFLAKAFRFRFLAVRDAKSTSRFQIGSIDLYARTNTVPSTE
ncbi:peptide-N(4)-(N-acetyl-beta-glucosaminyl)asparagine amidase-like [Salvia splendens]|uniref:peptide-N(4)-(N-acetyl-beta- glucosaminyl)asparagine amidase-like n=1 Tax=Salvia splendens TaxID=180675 RepID=UPI001C26F506|nr:peptide-N(4)-(N-acetyl-beta-glucosaminyl)asparagine amidase-like [Salvia splendens]